MSFMPQTDLSAHSSASMEGGSLGSSGMQNTPPPIPLGSFTPAAPMARTAPRVIQVRPQKPITDSELRGKIAWQERRTPHFILQTDPDSFANAQAESIADELELAYSLIFSFTHESFSDRWNVFAADARSAALHGHALRSHVDVPERSLCLLHGTTQHLYADLIVHLTHAMRSNRYERHYAATAGWSSMEDAFALFLNERIALQPDVFPFYGADPDLVAHHIYYYYSSASIARTWELPADKRGLLDNLLFGAFFLYLGDTFSDDRIIQFSKVDGPVGTAQFADFFGASLDELEHAWIAHLPVSRISVTSEEQEQMLLRWERAIESRLAPL
jgi:hypothetical protein